MRVFARNCVLKKDDKQRTRARYYPSGSNAKCTKKYNIKKGGHYHAIAPISSKKSNIKNIRFYEKIRTEKRALEVNR